MIKQIPCFREAKTPALKIDTLCNAVSSVAYTFYKTKIFYINNKLKTKTSIKNIDN